MNLTNIILEFSELIFSFASFVPENCDKLWILVLLYEFNEFTNLKNELEIVVTLYMMIFEIYTLSYKIVSCVSLSELNMHLVLG